MARNEFTYDQIKSLIVSEEVDNRTVFVAFALPGSDEVHECRGSIPRDTSVAGRVKQQVGRQVANQARRGLSQMLRGILGGGFLGRTASQVVNTSTRETARNISQGGGASRSQVEEAVVKAFQRVARKFHYDAASSSWRAAGPNDAPAAAQPDPSPFQAQLTASPVNASFERSVLARVLAHIAYSDGSLSEEEIDFFKSSIPASLGTVQELAQKDAVSAIEAEEISQGVRESIYMLAWTISAVDMDIDNAEATRLNGYAQKFSIEGDRKSDLERFAKVNVLENYLTEDTSRSELFALAAKLELTEDEAERAKIHWMKRQ